MLRSGPLPSFALPACLRQAVAGGLLAALAWAAGTGAAQAFSFEDVARKAQALAAGPYVAPSFAIPAELDSLSYDEYRDIRFIPEKALWRRENLPFEMMFFHLGKFQTQPVVINEVTQAGVWRVDFDRRNFDYGRNMVVPERWGDLGYAGFRVHYPLNSPKYKDELVVFLGASYFRALGKGQRYGLSARGLAIDTVGGGGEEFPRFTEFWVERPRRGARSLVIHALLDSPRVAGAYRFTITPGEETTTEVQARLYLRAGVATLGIAPLTSMFDHGENQPRLDDFRPEVHDSDGLMLATTDGAGHDEWLWRPLVNPSHLLVTSFSARELKGFGLMQRDRNFSSYEDTEARYEQRPSVWITPTGSWGPGRVELVQIPTADETNDNIVAYWVPEHVPAPGEPFDIAYKMRWQGDRQQHPPSGWAVQARRGRGFIAAGTARDPGEIQYVIDFTGPSLKALPAGAKVNAVVTAGVNGIITDRNAYFNSATGTWRMTLRVNRLQPLQPEELRAFLRSGDNALTETWTAIIPPD